MDPRGVIKINVAPGIYDASLRESFPLSVPYGTEVEADFGFSVTATVGNRIAPVWILEPNPSHIPELQSRLYGFTIQHGAIGVFAYAGSDQMNSARIENNCIEVNDGTFGIWTPPGPLRYGGGGMWGIGISAFGTGRTRVSIEHNYIRENYLHRDPCYTLGVGVMVDVEGQAGDRSNIAGNMICDHEENVVTTNMSGAMPSDFGTRIASNFLYFAEVNVRCEGSSRPDLVHNTVAFPRPSSDVRPAVVDGLRIADQADPSLVNNLFWNPATQWRPECNPLGITFLGRDIDVTGSGLYRGPGIERFWQRHSGSWNVFYNGVWDQNVNHRIQPPMNAVWPGVIEFVNGVIDWNAACGGLDLHLRGYRSPDPGDLANALLIDRAPIGPVSPGSVYETAIDVEADPRIAFYAGRAIIPDFGGDEVMPVRIVFLPSPNPAMPSYEGVFGDFAYRPGHPGAGHTSVRIGYRFDAFHPLAYIERERRSLSPFLTADMGTANYFFGEPIGSNFLLQFPPQGFLWGQFSLDIPILGSRPAIEVGLHSQWGLVRDVGNSPRIPLTNRVYFELNDVCPIDPFGGGYWSLGRQEWVTFTAPQHAWVTGGGITPPGSPGEGTDVEIVVAEPVPTPSDGRLAYVLRLESVGRPYRAVYFAVNSAPPLDWLDSGQAALVNLDTGTVEEIVPLRITGNSVRAVFRSDLSGYSPLDAAAFFLPARPNPRRTAQS